MGYRAAFPKLSFYVFNYLMFQILKYPVYLWKNASYRALSKVTLT